jgi:hypothetical protein
VLRLGYLPSDFNPMLLILCEAEDLRLLAGALRRFARELSDVRLDQLGFCTSPRTAVTMTASAGAPGIQPVADNSFVWRLNAQRATAFADQVDQLAAPSRAAGSEILQCSTEEEIPVKLSRGEYTDDFLVEPDRLSP